MTAEENIIHRCNENWYDGIDIKYQRINVEAKSWVINYTWYADQGAVDDGFAEKVGSIIMGDMMLISYCPFCGKKLTDQKGNTW